MKKVKICLQWHQDILIFSTAEKNTCHNDISRFLGEGAENAFLETVWLLTLSFFNLSESLYLAFAELGKDSSTASHEQPRGICINLCIQISFWVYFGSFMMMWGNEKVLRDDKMSEHVTVKNSLKQGYVPAQLFFTAFMQQFLLLHLEAVAKQAALIIL